LAAAVGDDALDRRDRRADARDLAPCLPAAPDYAESLRARPREVPRRDGARRAGAELTQLVGLEYGVELSVLAAEEQDGEARPVAVRDVHLPAGEAESVVHCGHVREHPVLEPEPPPRRELDGAAPHG